MTSPRRVTLVTGGARRVGAALVRGFAARGDAVMVHYGSSRTEAEELCNELTTAGGEIAIVGADLTEPDAPARVVQAAHAHFGRLDVLVNSAASMHIVDPREITPDEWDAIFALNLRAPFFAAQAAARVMSSGGCIINIADHLAFETAPRLAAHAAAKNALVHVTRTLARAFGPDLRVNAIAPGLVLAPNDSDVSHTERFLRHVPLGRVGAPEDVAQAALWLSEAAYVTGITLPVDGGRGVAF